MEAPCFWVWVGEDVAHHPFREADGRQAGDVRVGAGSTLDEVVLTVEVLVEELDPLQAVFGAGAEDV